MRYHMLTARIIQNAAQAARSLGHSCVGTEHLLLALVQNPGPPGHLLRTAGLAPGLTRTMTVAIRGKGTADLPLVQGFEYEVKSVLRQAAREARGQKMREICPEHLLLAMTRQEGAALPPQTVDKVKLSAVFCFYLKKPKRPKGKWRCDVEYKQ